MCYEIKWIDKIDDLDFSRLYYYSFETYRALRGRKYLTIFDDTTGIRSIYAHNGFHLILFIQVLFTRLKNGSLFCAAE